MIKREAKPFELSDDRFFHTIDGTALPHIPFAMRVDIVMTMHRGFGHLGQEGVLNFQKKDACVIVQVQLLKVTFP